QIRDDAYALAFQGTAKEIDFTRGAPVPERPGAEGTKERTKATRELTEAEKAHRDLMEEIAAHEGVVESVRMEYANAELRRIMEKEEADARASESIERLIADMQFENSLIGKSVEEQERLIAARLAGAAATEEQIETIRNLLRVSREGREAEGDMRFFEDGARRLFGTIVPDSAS